MAPPQATKAHQHGKRTATSASYNAPLHGGTCNSHRKELKPDATARAACTQLQKFRKIQWPKQGTYALSFFGQNSVFYCSLFE